MMAKQQIKKMVDLEGPAGSLSFKGKGATRSYDSAPDKSKKRTKDIELKAPVEKKKRAIGLS